MMTDNQNDKAVVRQYGEFSVDAWLVASSEDSAPAVSPSVTTQKEAGELSVERANILTLIREADQPDRRKATGPRTELGRQRSSQNALKSGILSRATLLNGESKFEYRSLLEDLLKTCQPKGRLEEILVEKLVTIVWRYRRLLVAEGAEIQKHSEFLEIDRQCAEKKESEEISLKQQEGRLRDMSLGPVGLMWDIHNMDVLEHCKELLVELRDAIQRNGLNWDRDSSTLMTIYGNDRRPHLRLTLLQEYWEWFNTSKVSETERKEEGYATPEECRAELLRLVNSEINYLIRYRKIESKRREVEILRQRVPDSPGLDRLLRYESTLERAFDRTLAQLERAQRMRKGQPLPPQLDIKIS